MDEKLLNQIKGHLPNGAEITDIKPTDEGKDPHKQTTKRYRIYYLINGTPRTTVVSGKFSGRSK